MCVCAWDGTMQHGVIVQVGVGIRQCVVVAAMTSLERARLHAEMRVLYRMSALNEHVQTIAR